MDRRAFRTAAGGRLARRFVLQAQHRTQGTRIEMHSLPAHAGVTSLPDDGRALPSGLSSIENGGGFWPSRSAYQDPCGLPQLVAQRG